MEKTDHTSQVQFTAPDSIEEFLQQIALTGEAGDAPQRLRDAAQMYLVAQHGIGVCDYLPELPPDFPDRGKFQQMLDGLRGNDAGGEPYVRFEKDSRQLALEILRSDYPQFCPEHLKEHNAGEVSRKASLNTGWPKAEDFIAPGQNSGIKR